jgi:hypothetical protein
VFLGEPRKVQISKNIAQQYEALETILFQNASSLARPAGLRPQMQVREDQGLYTCRSMILLYQPIVTPE